MVDEFAVAEMARRLLRELTRVRRDIGNALCVTDHVPVRRLLHAAIPTLLVSVVDELFGENFEMLPGDAGHAAVFRAVSCGPMTSGARTE